MRICHFQQLLYIYFLLKRIRKSMYFVSVDSNRPTEGRHELTSSENEKRVLLLHISTSTDNKSFKEKQKLFNMQRLQNITNSLCRKTVVTPKMLSVHNFSSNINKNENDTTDIGTTTSDVKLSGFAKAFEKFNKPQESEKIPEKEQTFAALLRNSKFIDLGNPEGKIVTGKIFHIVDDDLYIDFGWKFHCVCPRPLKNGREYVRGASVRLRVKELELSTKFLGASKDLTILEADCTLMGLINTPMKNVKTL